VKNIFSYELFTWKDQTFYLENLILAGFILILFPLLFILFKRFFLNPYFDRKNIEIGRRFAISQLIKYLVYFLTFIFAVQSFGLQLSYVWAAGAALLVGIGLGLQQTFNDFASGIILLIEGSVEKGDWIEVGNTVGEVKKIGLRTSLITTRRNISIIVPNSKITIDNVINLSHSNDSILHMVTVGVAYDSDVKLVEKLLIECANNHPKVNENPFVRFSDFGNSSLDFELLFWSDEYHRIELVRSDLRFAINEVFKKNHIVIPFPQRDLNIKNSVLD
jgi:small-conductance mechanosensitive channel